MKNTKHFTIDDILQKTFTTQKKISLNTSATEHVTFWKTRKYLKHLISHFAVWSSEIKVNLATTFE